MKPWKWIKNHPAEAMAIAAGVAVTGGAILPALGVGAGAAGAGALAAETGGPALLGADLATGASLGAGAAAGPGAALAGAAGEDFAAQMAGSTIAGGAAPESAWLAAMPAGEDFAAQMAAQSMAAGMPGQYAGLGGAEASLFDTSQLANPKTAMGPPESTWLSRFGDKLKDPKTVMRLGMMTANMGTPRQQGGPAPVSFDSGPYAPARHAQEEITKKWLLINDPNTYRRIYGDPQQGAA